MGEESRQVELCLIGAAACWGVSALLIVAASLTPGPSYTLARLGFWVALVALAWTVSIIVKRAKRSVVRAVARELALHNRPAEQEGVGLSVIR